MAKESHPGGKAEGTEKESHSLQAPFLSLPKGGGAISRHGREVCSQFRHGYRFL